MKNFAFFISISLVLVACTYSKANDKEAIGDDTAKIVQTSSSNISSESSEQNDVVDNQYLFAYRLFFILFKSIHDKN